MKEQLIVSKRKTKSIAKLQLTKSRKKWRKEVIRKLLMRKISQLIASVIRKMDI
jgi:hypothetical protein